MTRRRTQPDDDRGPRSSSTRLRRLFHLSEQHGKTSRLLGALLVLLGAGIIAGGIPIGGPVEAIAIEIGAAAAVGGIVLLFEPSLRRRLNRLIAEAVAAGTAERESRAVRLGGIGEVQADELKRQQSDAEAVIASLDDAVTFANVSNLLDVAYTQGLFTESVFVKTSPERGQPLLAIAVPGKGQIAFGIYGPVGVHRSTVQFEIMPEGTTVWHEGTEPSVIIGDIISAYKRLKLPHSDLSLEMSFAQLNESYRTLFVAHQEPTGSLGRLNGRLIFLVNKEWALTDVGLEGIVSEDIFTPGRSSAGFWSAIDIANTPCPHGCDAVLWEEAQYYMRSMFLVITDIWEDM